MMLERGGVTLSIKESNPKYRCTNCVNQNLILKIVKALLLSRGRRYDIKLNLRRI